MGQWGELPLNRLKYFYHNTFCWCQFGTLGTEKSITSLSHVDFSQKAITSNARDFVVMIKMAIWILLPWKSLIPIAINEPISVIASPDISPGLLRTTTTELLSDVDALAGQSCHFSSWWISCVLSHWWGVWSHVVLSLWHITSLSLLLHLWSCWSSNYHFPEGEFTTTALAFQSPTLRVLFFFFLTLRVLIWMLNWYHNYNVPC